MFIGRKNELSILATDLKSPKSEFCILYGRRRIGKSTLLRKFTENKNLFYFQAGKESKKRHLKRFTLELGETLGDPLISKTRINEWEEALQLLDRSISAIGHGSKAIIIFDEFQWMCNGSLELLSDMQRLWDNKWKENDKIFLILCGSSISFMLGEVLSRKSPLFGRRTRSINLLPFNLSESAEFFPHKNKFEIAEIYMATGGIPKYLEIFSKTNSFQNELLRHGFSSSGFFFDEVTFILSEQLKEKEHYFRVLDEISKGVNEISDLAKKTSINSGQITYYLERLQLLGFVSRHTPIGENLNSKRVRYRLTDYYLKFYFSFIKKTKEMILSNTRLSFNEYTGNRWDTYAGICFENICRDHANIIANQAGYKNKMIQSGSYWQKPTKRKKGVQIDLIIECSDNTSLICECKWSRKKIGVDAVDKLVENLNSYPNKQNHTLQPVLIASAGVSKNVASSNNIIVLTLEDLF